MSDLLLLLLSHHSDLIFSSLETHMDQKAGHKPGTSFRPGRRTDYREETEAQVSDGF